MPMMPHGLDAITGRRLFSLALPSADALPAQLDISSKHFACLLAMDARSTPVALITRLGDQLLRAGASYFICWGPDCEKVEYIIDQMVSMPDNHFGVPVDSCIMTTSHASEPLSEALWFLLRCSWPDDAYFASTHAALAISVGSVEWATTISEALEDVEGFAQRVTASGVA